MRNYETQPLSSDEEASVLADLNQEIVNAKLRTDWDLGSDSGSLYFSRDTLILTPFELSKLFKLPESFFVLPEEAKIPSITENPMLRNRFKQLVGIMCFLQRVIPDVFSRDDFSRTRQGIFEQESPLQLLSTREPVQAYTIIKEPAKFWGFRDTQIPRRSVF